MINNRLIIKNSLLLYFRLVVVSISGIITTSLILRSLGINNFGLYSVVGGIVTIMSLLNIIMVTTSYRYIAFELGKEDIAKINSIFNICFTIHIAIALLFLIFSITIGRWYIINYLNVSNGTVADALFVFKFSVIGAAVSVLGVPFQGLLIAKERFIITALTEIFVSILKVLMAILLLYYFSNKLRTYSVFMGVFTIIPTLVYIIYCRNSFGNISKWAFQRGWNKYKEILNFSIWVGYGAVAFIGKSQGAALMINSFFGTALNSAMGIAANVNTVINSLATSVGDATVPQITKSFSAEETKRTENLVIALSKYSFFLILIPSLPILLDTEYILKIWLIKVPAYTVIFTRLILIDTLVGSVNSGISSVIMASGKIKVYQLVVNSTLLLSLPLSYLVLKAGYEPYFIQISFIFISIIVFIIRQYMLKKAVNFNSNRLIKESYLPAFFVSISVLPLFLLRRYFVSSLETLILFSLGSLIYSLGSIYLIGMSSGERNRIKIVFINYKNKIIN